MTNFIPEVKFLTGGWAAHWSYREGYYDVELAIEAAKELAEQYFFTRVTKDGEVVWKS